MPDDPGAPSARSMLTGSLKTKKTGVVFLLAVLILGALAAGVAATIVLRS